MNDTSVYFKGYLTVLCCAGLFALLAIPLILRKVPRNAIYGYRTARTLKSEKVWYAANAFFGWCLIASSTVSAIAIKLIYSSADLEPNQFMNASIVSLVGPLFAAILLTHLKIRKTENKM